jgi:glycosyltransferase involved in cell wall biosynthesis
VPVPDAAALWLLDDAPIMGGAEAFALRLCSWLTATDPEREIRILCPGASELARRAEAAGVGVVSVEYPLPRIASAAATLLALTRIRRLLASAPAGALMVANSARAQAYAVPAWRSLRGKQRLVLVMHEQDSAIRPVPRWVLRRVGAVAAVGDAGTATYSAAVGRPVSRLVNFLRPDEVRDAASSRVAAPGAKPVVVGVLSRMFPGKGIVELVDELTEVRSAWSAARIAAPFQDAAYTQLVRERISAHGLEQDLVLLGAVDDVPAFLAEVDIVVVPSTGTEGQPTVVLESLAHGRPVLLRAHLWQAEYEGLPVAGYESARELEAMLERWGAQPPEPVEARELIERFDPTKVLATLERAAAV